MLDLFGRYTFKQSAGAVLLTLATLSAIVWIATALRELKILTAQGQSVLVFLKITTLALPSLMAIIAPIAVLAASIYTLNRLNGDSELIVMNASGATIWRIGRPFILLGVVVALFVILVNVYVMPASLRLMREEITRVRADLISQVLNPGRFSSPESGVTFHIRDRSDDGELLGLLVHDSRSPNQAMTHLADHARLVKSETSAYLIMYDGQIHQRQRDTGDTRIIVYKQNVFDLSEMVLKTPEVLYRPRERFIGELIWPDPDDKLYKSSPGRFRAELHERFSSPLYPIAFAMIALAALGRARTNRQGRVLSIGMAIFAAAGARFGGIAASNVADLHTWALVLLYAIPATTILIAGLIAGGKIDTGSWLEAVTRMLTKLVNHIRNYRAGSGAQLSLKR